MKNQRKKIWKIFGIGLLIYILLSVGHFAYMKQVANWKNDTCFGAARVYPECPDTPGSEQDECFREANELEEELRNKCFRSDFLCLFLFYCE